MKNRADAKYKRIPPCFHFSNGVVSVAGKLTAKQQRFVEEYLVHFNATQAAICAGYSPKYAGQNADKLLKNTNVAAEIHARRTAVSKKLEITQERVLQELAAIGFARATDFVSVETVQAEKLGIHPITGEVVMLPAGWEQYVRVIDTVELSPVQQAAVASIKQGRNGVEVKFHDKVRALEKLGNHLGLFDANAAAPPGQENNLFDAIVGSAEEDLVTDEIPELEQEAAAGDDLVEPPGVQKP